MSNNFVAVARAILCPIHEMGNALSHFMKWAISLLRRKIYIYHTSSITRLCPGNHLNRKTVENYTYISKIRSRINKIMLPLI